MHVSPARPLIERLEVRVLFAAGTGHPEAPDWVCGCAACQGTLAIETHYSAGLAAQDEAAFAPSAVPVLESRPGALAKLYLDFDGDPSTYNTPAYDIDGNASSFSAQELTNIYEIWARVSEKFSVFDINVTTVDPGNLNQYETLRVLIGGSGSWTGQTLGGYAVLGGFSTWDPSKHTAFVFPGNLSNGNPKFVAEAAAHEAGHGFSLSHQSLFSNGQLVAAYNPGDAQRAPIMGMSYSAARGLWWFGTSINNLPQDDLANLSGSYNRFGYRPDEHGGSTSTATVLSGSSLSAAGVITQTTDEDWFRFTTTGGNVSLTANVAPYGAMLDATLEIRDANGNLVASSATASLSETITTNLAAGTYYAVVKSAGNYGDIGQYTLTATVPTETPPPAPVANIGGPYTVAEGGSIALNASASTGTGTLTYLWDLDNDGIFGETGSDASRGNETGVSPTFSAAGLDGPGTYSIGLRVTDSNGQSSTTSAAITLTNVGPTLTITGPANIATGYTYTLTLSKTDPGSDTLSNWYINWGDGSPIQTVAGNATSVTHTFSNPASVIISATASDEDGTWTSNSVSVTVVAAPVANIGGPYSVGEHGNLLLNGSSSTGSSPLTYAWDLDNDGIFGETGANALRGNETGATPTFLATGLDGPSSFPISLKVTDSLGNSSTVSTTITITNVAPTLSLSGPATVNEGSTYTLTLSKSDPGNDTITSWFIDWGDGNTQTLPGNTTSVTHVYADNGAYTISATATDEDGTYSAPSKSITVLNVAPTVILTGSSTVNEGATYTLGLSSSDPGADTVTSWLINWGDGNSQTVAGNLSSATHVYAAGGNSYTITVSAVDEDGTHGATSKTITVVDLPPTVTINGPASGSEGSTYTLTLSATDAGPLKITKWTINWGDGSTPQVVNGNPSTVTHTFADSGNYSITATATDPLGTHSAGSVNVVIHDVAPSLTVSGTGSATAGSAYSITLSPVTVPGTNSVSKYIIHWGDGETNEFDSHPGTLAHVYAAGLSSATITIDLIDANGTYTGVAVHTVTIGAVPPGFSISGPSLIAAGKPYTLDLSLNQANGHTITHWNIYWGDGSVETIAGNATSATHSFAGSQAASIYVTATTASGTYSAQNFVTVTVDGSAPTASATAAPITASSAAAHRFTVAFADNLSLDDSTITGSSVYVLDPQGNAHTLQLVSMDYTGSAYIATYDLAAPSGGWNHTRNGTYRIMMQSNAVHDSAGNAVAAGQIGSFAVSIVAPDASGPTVAGIHAPTITSLGTHVFWVTYTDDTGLDLSSITAGGLTIQGPDGQQIGVSLVSLTHASGNAYTATYAIDPAAIQSRAANGTYTIIASPAHLKDTNGNPFAGGQLGQFTVALAPSATIADKTRRVSLHDADGTLVTFNLSGIATADIYFENGQFALDIHSPDPRSALTITTVGGDGFTSLGNVSITGSMARIVGQRVLLGGSITSAGYISNITLANFTGLMVASARVTAPGNFDISLSPFGNARRAAVLDADGTLVTATLTGPGAARLFADGSAIDTTLLGTEIRSAFTLTTRGGDNAATLRDTLISGSLARFTAPTGNITSRLVATGLINNLQAANLLNSTVAATYLGPTRVSGSIINSVVLAGAHLGNDFALGNNDDTFAPGMLHSLTVFGSVLNSTVAAGLHSTDATIGNADDTLLPGGTIRALTIRGQFTNSSIKATTLPRAARIAGQLFRTFSTTQITDALTPP